MSPKARRPLPFPRRPSGWVGEGVVAGLRCELRGCALCSGVIFSGRAVAADLHFLTKLPITAV